MFQFISVSEILFFLKKLSLISKKRVRLIHTESNANGEQL